MDDGDNYRLAALCLWIAFALPLIWMVIRDLIP